MLYAISTLYTARKPVEDIWLKGKTFVRTQAIWTTCFEQIKNLFVKGIRQKKYFQFLCSRFG